MTDNNKIQAVEVPCNKISADLTEKWKKGKLKAGYYYVKNEFGNIFPSDYSEEYDSINDCGVLGFWNEVSEITEVTDKVPSYEEWKASEKYNKHLEEKIKIYERKEKQHTDDAIAYNELVEINAELKATIKKRETKIKELYETIDKFADSNLDLIKNIETLAQTLLKVSPEHREWLEVNYKEYL